MNVFEMDTMRVIDGGFSNQLAVHVGDCVDKDPLWSARFNATNPEMVIQVHLDYLRAGADAIITNTYQASVEGFGTYLALDFDASVELMKATVRMAHEARDQFLADVADGDKQRVPLIFASISPYGAHLHDGSEYTGNYVDQMSGVELQQWHRTRIDAVIEAGVDGLAIETIPSKVEAEALLELMANEHPDVKFWISFQCKDDCSLAHGESFTETVHDIWTMASDKNVSTLLAVGINCTNPNFISALLRPLNGQYPVVVYPNNGDTYDTEKGWYVNTDGDTAIETFVPEWKALGVCWVGGCCRIGADDIKNIKRAVCALEDQPQKDGETAN